MKAFLNTAASKLAARRNLRRLQKLTVLLLIVLMVVGPTTQASAVSLQYVIELTGVSGSYGSGFGNSFTNETVTFTFNIPNNQVGTDITLNTNSTFGSGGSFPQTPQYDTQTIGTASVSVSNVGVNYNFVSAPQLVSWTDTFYGAGALLGFQDASGTASPGAPQFGISNPLGSGFDPAVYDLSTDLTTTGNGYVETFNAAFPGFPSYYGGGASFAGTDENLLIDSVASAGTISGSFTASVLAPILETTPADGTTVPLGPALVGVQTIGTDITATNVGSLGGLNGDFQDPTSGQFVRAGAEAYGVGSGALDPMESESRTYQFAPTNRGSFSADVTVTSEDNPADNSTITLTGQGVAPLLQVDSGSTTLAFGDVRVGDSSASQSIDVTNVGDGNLSGLGTTSNLNLTLANSDPSNSEFSGGANLSLQDNQSGSFSYTFSPTDRGTENDSFNATFSNGNPDGTNTPTGVAVSLSGRGVGPIASVFDEGDGTIDGVIDFGTVETTSATQMLTLLIDNESDDAVALADLNAQLNATLGGTPFSATLVDDEADADGVGGGDYIEVLLTFDPSFGEGSYNESFSIATDEGAALNDFNGTAFGFNLTGSIVAAAVPEPSTLLLWGLLGLIGGGFHLVRRRRRQQG